MGDVGVSVYSFVGSRLVVNVGGVGVVSLTVYSMSLCIPCLIGWCGGW